MLNSGSGAFDFRNYLSLNLHPEASDTMGSTSPISQDIQSGSVLSPSNFTQALEGSTVHIVPMIEPRKPFNSEEDQNSETTSNKGNNHTKTLSNTKVVKPKVVKQNARVFLACNRCKLKKRKCDGQLPCKLCTKSKAECEYCNKLPLLMAADTESQQEIEKLNKEIQLIENHNELIRQENNSLKEHIVDSKQAEVDLRLKNDRLEQEITVLKSLLEKSNELHSNLLKGPSRSLHSNNTSERNDSNQIISSLDEEFSKPGRVQERYQGSHSLRNNEQLESRLSQKPTNSEDAFDLSLSKLLFRSVNESHEYIGSFAVISIVKAIRKNILGDADIIEESPVILDDFQNENAVIPKAIEDSFIKKFFSLAHNRHYFMDATWFFGMIKKSNEDRTPWDCFCFNMVLGIGCRLDELQNVRTYPSPDIFLRRALGFLKDCELGLLEQIQACLLISLFIGRSYHLSFYVTSWELAGLAMRKLIQYGFHRKQKLSLDTAASYEFRKRLFWSAYNYEKLLSLSLGRPCCINDNFIDVPFPISIDLPMDPTSDMLYNLYELQIQQETGVKMETSLSEFSCLVYTSQVRQMEGRAHCLFYSVNKTVPMMDTFTRLDNDLDDWFSTLPDENTFNKQLKNRECYSYLTLLYHRAKLILYLPRVITQQEKIKKEMLLNQICLSAGWVCTSYKELYNASILEFSVVALHTVFLAGVSMIYYLKIIGEPKFFNIHTKIRACFSLLFVFSERWPEAKTYSHLFEILLQEAENPKPTLSNIPNSNQKDVNETTKAVPHNSENRIYNGSNTNFKVRESKNAREDDVGENVTVSNHHIRQTSDSISGTPKINNLVNHFPDNNAVRRNAAEFESQRQSMASGYHGVEGNLDESFWDNILLNVIHYPPST
ncbi:organic cyclic compound binding protein [[Candida] boidinii]|nr:organic cyclic compound binding protein [[Candida] boidinii]